MATDSMEATLMRTAEAYMQVFTSLDPESILPIQTDGYRHFIAPASLEIPSPISRDQFSSRLKSLHEMLRTCPMHIKQAWPNSTRKQVLIWAEAEGEFHDAVKEKNTAVEWRFHGEYMWLLTMTEDGTKVREVLEFVDGKAVNGMKGLMAMAFGDGSGEQGESKTNV